MDIDDKIRRGIKIAGWSMLTLCLSPLLLVIVVRNSTPTKERQTALDVLHAPTPPVHGRDGSDALWLLDYDVPAAEQPKVAKALRRFLDEYDRLTIAKQESRAKKLTDPRANLSRFPRIEANPSWLCSQRGLECLAAVRSDPQGAASAVEANAAGLAAVARFMESDGTRLGVRPSYSQEIPQWGTLQRLVRTRYALDFVQGRQIEALSGLCRDIRSWRRHAADTDMMIGAMVAGAYVARDLQLLSEILAELPADASLPAQCNAALAPTSERELDLCPEAKQEFRALENLLTEDMASGLQPTARFLMSLGMDADHAVAVTAPAYAAYCRKPMHEAAALDRLAASARPPRPKCGVLDKVSDPIGCTLAEVSADYHAYQDRLTDLAAQVALMRTIAWVRANGTGTQADFDKRPASLGLRRQVEVSADGREVSIPLYDQRKEKRYVLQLKASPPA